MRIDEVKRMPTSEEWRTVREFVNKMRVEAHELVVDKSIIEDTFKVHDRLGHEMVSEMIWHERRMMNMNVTQRFWMEKDAQDEADYEAQTTNRSIGDAEQREANHGV